MASSDARRPVVGGATATGAAVDIRPLWDRRDRDRFVMLPWQIYEHDPHWVPPLIGDEKKFIDPEKNPFFEHSEAEHFLAWRDGRVVGRIAAIHNRNHNELHEDKVGFFGLFECIDDADVAEALLDTAEAWVKERGLDTLRGPMNYTTNDTCGLLVEGFDGPPFVMMPHNPVYYPTLVEGAGFTKAKDLLAYYMHEDSSSMDRAEKFAERIRRRGNVTVRSIDKKRWDDEVAIVRHIYNAAWEKNWGFVPFTPHEFDHLADSMKKIVDPNIVCILELDGEPIGFGLGLPDVNIALKTANGRLFPFGLIKILIASRRINRIRVPILGLLKEHRRTGYDLLLYLHLFKVGTSRGYHAVEMSWLLEDNHAILRPLEKIGGRLHRVYRVYDRPVR